MTKKELEREVGYWQDRLSESNRKVEALEKVVASHASAMQKSIEDTRRWQQRAHLAEMGISAIVSLTKQIADISNTAQTQQIPLAVMGLLPYGLNCKPGK